MQVTVFQQLHSLDEFSHFVVTAVYLFLSDFDLVLETQSVIFRGLVQEFSYRHLKIAICVLLGHCNSLIGDAGSFHTVSKVLVSFRLDSNFFQKWLVRGGKSDYLI